MNLSHIKVFRITHIDNIPHIMKNGITHRDSSNANPHYVAIGDQSLIDIRGSKNIETTNGDAICLGDFVPFYFGVKMPMLYVIQNGYNNVSKTEPEKIIYLVCSVEGIVNQTEEVYFSDGHATNALSAVYDKLQLSDLPRILDWKAINEKDWGGEQNRDLKRKKEAEFLVKGDIAPEQIIIFGCYNDIAKQKLISYGIDASKIKVSSQAYY